MSHPVHHLLLPGSDQPLLLDGGLATELEAAGHDIGTQLWSAALLMDQPEAILKAHQAYIAAGADCITSASYQASRQGFMARGLGLEQADQLIGRSIRLARRAAVASGRGQTLIAASIGPYGAILHDGSEYRGGYGLTEQQLYDFHAQRLPALLAEAPDLLACETIPDQTEARALHRLLGEQQTPAWVSFQCRDQRHLADGTPLKEVAGWFNDHPQVLAVGINCTAPQYLPALIEACRESAPAKKVLAYPNSGERFDVQHNVWRGTATASEYAQATLKWLDCGAHWVGGCCRVGPQHIAAMRAAIDGRAGQ